MRYESTSHARDVADEVAYKRREAMHKMVASINNRVDGLMRWTMSANAAL